MAVHIGTVRGVHQSDDGVIDPAGKHLPLDEAWRTRSRHRHAWRFRAWSGSFASRCGHVDPDQPIMLAQRVRAHANARRIELLSVNQGRDRSADAVVAELPAVIGALDGAFAEY